jgi:hypothetical protein
MTATYLQHAFASLHAELYALERDPCVRYPVDNDDPIHLRNLAELSIRIARSVDRIFNAIGDAGGIEGYECSVTEVIDGNLEFELWERARDFDEERDEDRRTFRRAAE